MNEMPHKLTVHIVETVCYAVVPSSSTIRAYQSAGEPHHSHGGLGGLGHVQQVVEQSLVLVVGEQVELVQDEQHRTAAAAVP